MAEALKTTAEGQEELRKEQTRQDEWARRLMDFCDEEEAKEKQAAEERKRMNGVHVEPIMASTLGSAPSGMLGTRPRENELPSRPARIPA